MGIRSAAAVCAGALLVIACSCGGNASPTSGAIPVKTVTLPSRTVTYNVPSSSMEPTLHCAQPEAGCEAAVSDGAVAQEPARAVKQGDVVVFRTPNLAQIRCGAGGIFIKRIIGMPGDVWSEKNGYVYINGKKLNEPYISPDRRDTQTIRSVNIAPGRYFVMGDNRNASCDSREWGTVPAANLIGKVVQIIRPQ
jgi:signal peptidase I